jgi:hypothetical protein
MDKLIYLLPILFCPAVMGGMMWMMLRGSKHTGDAPQVGVQDEVAALRAEVETLRADKPGQQQHSGVSPTVWRTWPTRTGASADTL